MINPGHASGDPFMKVEHYCVRNVAAISAAADVVDAARLMRERHVGFLVVFREGDALRSPIGVVTDRDIVLQVTAKEVDPRSVTVEDVMTRQPMIATEDDDVNDLIEGMRLAGIRRAPVIDSRGALCGIIAIDDVIDVIATLLGHVAGSIKSEQRQEWHRRQT